MNYIEKLKHSAEKAGHIACLGLDPMVEYLPEKYRSKGIRGFPNFVQDIFEEMVRRGVSPAAVKPNDAFYACHNDPRQREVERWHGYNALSDVVDISQGYFKDIPVILDVKREDIGSTAERYAHACHAWDVEAVTIGAYVGKDSIAEFLKNEKIGAYVLCLTSNESSKDFQHLYATVKKELRTPLEHIHPLYMHVTYHVLYADYTQNSQLGLVLGASDVKLFRQVVEYITKSGRQVPLLIPGVGTQGGSATDIVRILSEVEYDQRLARINSSSAITHPWKDNGAPPNAIKVCVDAFEKLAEECAL